MIVEISDFNHVNIIWQVEIQKVEYSETNILETSKPRM